MIRRSSKFKMLGGVCAGYAISEKLPVALVRTFVLMLLLGTGGLFSVVYLVAWLVMPGPESAEWDRLPVEDQLVRKKSDQVISGVCGAFARYFKVDATLVRALTVISVFILGTGLLVYLFAWMVLPEAE